MTDNDVLKMLRQEAIALRQLGDRCKPGDEMHRIAETRAPLYERAAEIVSGFIGAEFSGVFDATDRTE